MVGSRLRGTPAVRVNPVGRRAGDPPEMVRATNQYVDFVHLQWGLYLHQPSVFIEQEVDVSQWVPGGFGTCDCLLIGDGILHIIDFKYGQGVPVNPEHNPQLMYYALGAYALFDGIDEVDTVRLSIVQPRMQEEPQTWELPLADLLTWAREVLAPAATWHGGARACTTPEVIADSARLTRTAGHGRTSTARWPGLNRILSPLHSPTKSWANGCRSWKAGRLRQEPGRIRTAGASGWPQPARLEAGTGPQHPQVDRSGCRVPADGARRHRRGHAVHPHAHFPDRCREDDRQKEICRDHVGLYHPGTRHA